MELQEILALFIVFAAFCVFGRGAYKKLRTFSPKSRCGAECGCSDNSGNSSTAT